MENTLENKTKFFAQYWGQFICVDIDKTEHARQMLLCFMVQSTDYIVLKPLSSITDEEILEYKNFQEMKEMDDNYFIDNYREYMKTKNYSSYFVDYFRSKGFAIEWLGLSVEKLQEYGWIKLA